ncbi:hypothetical protein N7456_001821 [Penicillium angulare]|uniref:Uncharacterized protein n=1 Tax=Penicillium angulare TaxID=116970 RepID=A0A9W9G8C2_9EURO|nr:hypothetical protein N7456_001821 [Penicillium angulare]
MHIEQLLFLSTLLLNSKAFAADSSSTSSGNCTTFNWNQDDAKIAYYAPIRISSGQSCPDSKGANSTNTCPLSANGAAQFSAESNITAFQNPSKFAPLVEQALESANVTMPAPYFNDSVISRIDQTRILEAGQSAYLNFTALKFCYEGSLSDCSGSLEDGTKVEFCAPLWSEKDSLVSGEYTVVNISKSEVGQYKDPYAGQSDGTGSDGDKGIASGRVLSEGLMTAGVIISLGLATFL